MTQLATAAREARRLLLSCYDGVLATISVAVPGYPFGSVVPFCLDRAGRPIVLIANIAQHRKNLVADPKVSLTVFDRGADDLQSNGRLTLIADAVPVAADDADTMTRYYRYFPESQDYHLTHSFEFWRLQSKRIRYIGGFGAIHWLEPAQLIAASPFSAADEAAMVAHMNADHRDAMQDYLKPVLGAEAAAASTPTLAGVDAEGIHLRTERRVWRLEFSQPVATPGEVRKALVEMARAARA
ncbi:MAG: HugZ family protein [Gammaproteobacteria bacterium]